MYTGDGCPHCPQMEASASTPQRCIVKLWWTRQTLLWNNWVMSDCADNFGFHTHTRAHTHTDASNNHSTHREKLVSGKNANISYVSSYKFSTQWVQIPSKSQDTLLDTLYKHFSFGLPVWKINPSLLFNTIMTQKTFISYILNSCTWALFQYFFYHYNLCYTAIKWPNFIGLLHVLIHVRIYVHYIQYFEDY